MTLKTYKLGSLLEPFSQTCGIPDLPPERVSGVNREKEFFEPARQVGGDTSNYKVVPAGYFACNLMHVGRDGVLPLAMNRSDKNKIVSPAYSIFRIKDETLLLSEYFFMLMKSDEKDRLFWFHADSSVRDGLPWDAFCDVELRLPDINVQSELVNIYESLEKNQNSYEVGLDDLKLVCDAYIEKVKNNPQIKTNRFLLGELIKQRREKYDGSEIPVKGVTREGFIEPKQEDADLRMYNLFYYDDFVFNPARMEINSIALNCYFAKACCSSLYEVFYVSRPDVLLPGYLNLLLKRDEFARWCSFSGWGSAREYCRTNNLAEYPIVIPTIEIQSLIMELYRAYMMRKQINEKLKETIKNICPILIRGSLQYGG